MPGRPVDIQFVRKLALALPGVEEGTIHGAPCFRLRGKLLACPALHRSAGPGSLAVRIDIGRREELLAAEPGIYHVTQHYVSHPMVLVRLSRIGQGPLRELLDEAWQALSRGARKVRKKPGALEARASLDSPASPQIASRPR